MTTAVQTANPYLQEFLQQEKTLPGNPLPWLRQRRSEAITRFGELGFPTIRDEAWRFTSVEPIAKTAFKQSSGKASLPSQTLQTYTFEALKPFQLVFVNGRYVETLSTIPKLASGVRAGSLAAFLETNGPDLERHLGRYADAKNQAFTALQTAFFIDGAHVYLPKGTVLQTPIHLLFISTPEGFPTLSHPRVLIVAEQDTQATIVESYVGPAGSVYFTNAVSEVVLGDNARLDHYKLERESTAAYHVSTLQVHQARNSRFNSHAVLLGGALVRHAINVVLDAEGAECSLNGLYMIGGKQHVDTHTSVDHVKPHGTSREYYKGVLDGTAHAVFDGQVIVRPDAQKTDSVQTNKNLLLSNDAKIDTKPELKIFANDVKCKHGATIGQISPEALFYLRSRGVGLEDARRLLIYAFVSEMLNRLEWAPLRDALSTSVLAPGS